MLTVILIFFSFNLLFYCDVDFVLCYWRPFEIQTYFVLYIVCLNVTFVKKLIYIYIIIGWIVFHRLLFQLEILQWGRGQKCVGIAGESWLQTGYLWPLQSCCAESPESGAGCTHVLWPQGKKTVYSLLVSGCWLIILPSYIKYACRFWMQAKSSTWHV